jgi:integrase
LIELSSRKLRREKIEWLKVFLGDQIDFRTGEPWREATKRAYVNRLSQIINYAINNSETDLTFNPFSKSVAFSVEWDPEIFALEEIELFLTYLYHWYPKLYIPFVLATWGGIRTGELKRMTYRAIKLNSPGCGWIKLDRNITKMKKTRTIREMRVQHLFTLLRAAPLGMGADDAKLVEGADWESDLFAAWRELMFKPFPHNGMRHTAASMLLEARGMETCARILGHDFRDTDKVLLDHYRSLVDPDMVKRFYEMLPQRDLTLEREAAYKYRLYTGWIDGAATTRLWPNCRMHYMHQMNTGSVDFVRNLRAKRPIFATAVGKSLEIEILHPDGRPEKLIIPCQRKLWAKKLEHRWRVAIYTGQGVLNFENGQVEHYVANFGALWGEKLYLLDNPEALLEAVKECREGVKPIARKVGCSTDILCDYMNPTRTKWVKARVIPGKFKKRLLALFPDLIFIPYTPKNDTMAWVSAGVDDVENAPNHLIGLSGSVTKSRLSLTCST